LLKSSGNIVLGGEWGKTGLVDRYRVEENISPSFFFFPSLNRHTASYYTSTAMPPRVSLLDRQNALLAKQGFSSSSSSTTAPRRSNNNRTASGHTKGFTARQEAHLLKQGRSNAVSASRTAVAWDGAAAGGRGDENYDDDDDDDDGADGGASTAPSTAMSMAPSLHPSMAGSTVSRACSEATIGAGDDTGYWDFCHRAAGKKDLGHNCRECRRPFTRIGEPLTERRGARTSNRYHAECFSGFADPRSQAGSSFHTGRLAGSQLAAAPQQKAGSKMRVTKHFDGGGDSRYRQHHHHQGGSLGKISAFSGGNGFGARSGKNKAGAAGGAGAHIMLEHDLSGFEDMLENGEEDDDVDDRGERSGGVRRRSSGAGGLGGGAGGLNAAMLAEHRKRMAEK
jgi:hypothetical protein